MVSHLEDLSEKSVLPRNARASANAGSENISLIIPTFSLGLIDEAPKVHDRNSSTANRRQ